MCRIRVNSYVIIIKNVKFKAMNKSDKQAIEWLSERKMFEWIDAFYR